MHKIISKTFLRIEFGVKPAKLGGQKYLLMGARQGPGLGASSLRRVPGPAPSAYFHDNRYYGNHYYQSSDGYW